MKRTLAIAFLGLLAGCTTTGGSMSGSVDTPDATGASQQVPPPLPMVRELAAPPAGATNAVANAPIPRTSPQGALYFYDSRIFDDNLSSALRGGDGPVEVVVTGGATINQIPNRIDHWLYVVSQNGGAVETAPISDNDMKTRGILADVVELVFSAFDSAREQALYSPAEKYNAKLLFDAATGKIAKVIFTPK